MFSFYAWLSSNSNEPIGELRDNAPGSDRNEIFVGHVNGDIHVRFSGNPNRDRGELQNILDYFLDGTYQFHGVIYINDAYSENITMYRVLKIFNDAATELEDCYFTQQEKNELFL